MAKETQKLSASYQVKVFYEDTDLSGFVYHANYLKYFERAREELFGAQRLRDLKNDSGIHFVVSELQIKFFRPAKHADTIDIHSTCEFDRGPAQTYIQTAFVDSTKICEAVLQVVCLNSSNRPARLPEDVLNYMLAKANP